MEKKKAIVIFEQKASLNCLNRVSKLLLEILKRSSVELELAVFLFKKKWRRMTYSTGTKIRRINILYRTFLKTWNKRPHHSQVKTCIRRNRKACVAVGACQCWRRHDCSSVFLNTKVPLTGANSPWVLFCDWYFCFFLHLKKYLGILTTWPKSYSHNMYLADCFGKPSHLGQ